MFMPFYFAGKNPPRVAIVGGGYAGLAALTTLREKSPEAEITLVDPRDRHVKVTHLHESFRRPFDELSLPFATLAQRFNVRHIQAELNADNEVLSQWNSDRQLRIGDEVVEFDYLMWATGAGERQAILGPHTLTLTDFCNTPGPELLDRQLASAAGAESWITVIGSGPTGIQFLFEIAHYIRSHNLPYRLRLVDANDAPLKQFNSKLGKYVQARLADLGIDYLPQHYFRGQDEDEVTLEGRDSAEQRSLPSALSLLFTGKLAAYPLKTNVAGQVLVEGRALDRVFGAGDCSRYKMPGSNAQSAQTALRKGKLAARNILRHAGPVKILEPYLHQDLGYVIGLGPSDAIGWLGLKGNVVGGLPAVVVKELVEAQYDLLLAGVDTYVL
ncbi:MAG: NAD(P)/FAD-dependent oxidoreductase [Methylococcaceae bacterium]|jgi:NADH dehydrogenase